jgi:hypothetical protein
VRGRHLRAVPRQQARTRATRAGKGEGFAAKSVPLGRFAAKSVSLASFHGGPPTHVPREPARVKDLLPKASPLGRFAAKSVSLASFHGGPPTRVPREPARVKDLLPKASPLGRFAAKSVSLGLPHGSKPRHMSRNRVRAKDPAPDASPLDVPTSSRQFGATSGSAVARRRPRPRGQIRVCMLPLRAAPGPAAEQKSQSASSPRGARRAVCPRRAHARRRPG